VTKPSNAIRSAETGEREFAERGEFTAAMPDLAVANRVLTAPATTKAESARKGEIYRQVLSLLLAGRRPAYYLLENRAALGKLTDTCLRNLADAG
jgi:hypothetical protein